MTNQQLPTTSEWVPTDTWGSRLAIVRQKMGWNISEAARECGLTAASWQNWEDGKGCRTMHNVAAKIVRRTGVSFTWLVAGGPLAAADPDELRSRCSEVIDLRAIPGGRKTPESTGQLRLPWFALV